MIFFVEKNESVAENKAKSLRENGYKVIVKKGIEKKKVVYLVDAEPSSLKMQKPKLEKMEPTTTELKEAEPITWDAE